MCGGKTKEPSRMELPGARAQLAVIVCSHRAAPWDPPPCSGPDLRREPPFAGLTGLGASPPSLGGRGVLGVAVKAVWCSVSLSSSVQY